MADGGRGGGGGGEGGKKKKKKGLSSQLMKPDFHYGRTKNIRERESLKCKIVFYVPWSFVCGCDCSVYWPFHLLNCLNVLFIYVYIYYVYVRSVLMSTYTAI